MKCMSIENIKEEASLALVKKFMVHMLTVILAGTDFLMLFRSLMMAPSSPTTSLQLEIGGYVSGAINPEI